MRPALFAGLVSLVIPASTFAQTGPYYATVADDGVKLRAGPSASDKFPETATLRKGTQLLVDHEEENGWLAVQNLPGQAHSISWVQGSLIDFDNNKPTPQNVMVEDSAALRVGQVGLAQPLPITRVTVPAGTGLTVIGPKVQFEGKWWYPVLPPAGDFRYIPKQSVTSQKSANTAFSVRDSIPEKSLPPAINNSGVSAPVASIPGPGSGMLPPPSGETGVSANKPAVQNPLWAQAETAEREGRYDEAEKLYFQLARQMNEPGGDHDIANLCYTRIHAIREKKRNGSFSSNPGSSSSGGTATPIVPVTRPVVGTNEKPPPPGPPPAEPKEERGKWTGPGRLVRSALALDGRRTYALETSPGVVVLYIVAANSNVDLERFVNKKVDIYGVSATRRDLSKPFVVATTIEPAQ